jgi:hypothetical protein
MKVTPLSKALVAEVPVRISWNWFVCRLPSSVYHRIICHLPLKHLYFCVCIYTRLRRMRRRRIRWDQHNQRAEVFELIIMRHREILSATEKLLCMYSFCTLTGFVVERVVLEPVLFLWVLRFSPVTVFPPWLYSYFIQSLLTPYLIRWQRR